jgi:hypothetical protein
MDYFILTKIISLSLESKQLQNEVILQSSKLLVELTKITEV